MVEMDKKIVSKSITNKVKNTSLNNVTNTSLNNVTNKKTNGLDNISTDNMPIGNITNNTTFSAFRKKEYNTKFTAEYMKENTTGTINLIKSNSGNVYMQNNFYKKKMSSGMSSNIPSNIPSSIPSIMSSNRLYKKYENMKNNHDHMNNKIFELEKFIENINENENENENNDDYINLDELNDENNGENNDENKDDINIDINNNEKSIDDEKSIRNKISINEKISELITDNNKINTNIPSTITSTATIIPNVSTNAIPNYDFNQNTNVNINDINNIYSTVKDKQYLIYSVGIACCRFVGDIPEILLVQKRYTYAFCDFVHGQYITKTPLQLHNALKQLLDLMTVEEKLIIMTLDFDMMWYKIWLNSAKIKSKFTLMPHYYSAKAKFHALHMADDGVKLKKLIEKSSSIGLLWEIPKGRKRKLEADINCAVREFYEETNITKQMYKILPFNKFTNQYIDNGNIYRTTYYVGITNKLFEPSIDFSSNEQIKEIVNIKFMNINEIRLIDKAAGNHNLENVIKPIWKAVKGL